MRYKPELFDISWCRFPYESHPSSPGPKARPCLVIGVEELVDGSTAVLVAYGTTKKGRTPYSVVVDDSAGRSLAWKDSGLLEPTAFCLDRIARLPYDKRHFPDVPTMRSRPALDHCRMGVAHQTVRRDIAATLRLMRENGLGLETTFDSVSKRVPRIC